MRKRSNGKGADQDAAEEGIVSDCDEFSDVSDNSDIFHVAVEPDKTWFTSEDRDWRLIDELKLVLREFPLLPSDPLNAEQSYMDVHSGVKFATVHFAIQGCNFSTCFQVAHHWHEERVLYRYLRRADGQKEMAAIFAHCKNCHEIYSMEDEMLSGDTDSEDLSSNGEVSDG